LSLAVRVGVLGWSRRHPVLTDAGWVVVLATLTGVDAAHSGRWVDILWQAALWVPLIFRRAHPVVVFVLVGLVAAGQWAFDAPLGGDLAVLMVLYTVAAHRSRLVSLAAAGAVELGGCWPWCGSALISGHGSCCS